MRLLLLLLLLVTAPAIASQTVRSPDGRTVVTVDVNGEGRPFYTVVRDGQTVIAPSALGFILADAPKLERNFAIAKAERASRDERWEQPWGERRFVLDRHNGLMLTLTEATRLKRSLTLEVRVFDDGLGFRFGFPETFGTVRIVEELTEFTPAEAGTAWWIPGGEWNRYEYLYNRTGIAGIGQAHTPLTMRLSSGLHLAIHEAALVDYPGMWLRRVEGQRLKARLSPAADGPPAVRKAPFTTPWRVILIGEDAAGLYQASDIILNLNAPNRLGDVSWFVPHKYAGVWWEMHLDTKTWGTGPRHGATNENVRRHIDFAAENGLRGVLVEGWNLGWDGDWFANGEDFDFTRSTPDFDLPALAAYGRKKGVRLMGHHETAGDIATYEPQLEAALDLYARNGVDSVKTGYVADAGGIRSRATDGRILYEWHDGQRMTRHHLKVVEEAAKRKIAVNPHEPVKDTGLRRTYPNWVSREGARGMEYNAWGNPPNPASHEPTLLFTRMLAGPMDYTPGIVSLEGRGGLVIAGTVARQLALYLAIYSPIQMVPDLPENYAKVPAALDFIRRVPVDWDETRMLAGQVGEYAVIARKDRHGDNWWLGAISNEAPREIVVPLAFLGKGSRWVASIWRDGPGGPRDLVVEERQVTAADQLIVNLAAGGGQAIEFRRR
jgi:alpha-glucosidase